MNPCYLELTIFYETHAATRDYKSQADANSLRYAQQYASPPPPPVSLEYLQAAEVIMTTNHITHMPRDTTEELHLYTTLVNTLEVFV